MTPSGCGTSTDEDRVSNVDQRIHEFVTFQERTLVSDKYVSNPDTNTTEISTYLKSRCVAICAIIHIHDDEYSCICKRYYAPDRREGGSMLCFCPSVRPSVCPSVVYIANNSRTRRPIACPISERRFPSFDATTTLVSRSKGQRSRSQGHVISLSRLGPMLYLCH